MITNNLLNCFNVYTFKEQVKNYKEILERPESKTEIIHRMMLKNIYLLRMLRDFNYKRKMYKRLEQAIGDVITQESIERFFIWLLDDFQELNLSLDTIFQRESTRKIQLDPSPLFTRLETVFSKILTEKQVKASINADAINWYQNQLEKYDSSTVEYQALEDLIQEYQTGKFTSRFIPIQSQDAFMFKNIDRYIDNALHHEILFPQPTQDMAIFFESLIPEYYICFVKIHALVKATLQKFIIFPQNFDYAFISLFNRHILSILMKILFDQLSTETQLYEMNHLCDFSLDVEDFRKIAENFEEYKSISYLRLHQFATESNSFYRETASGMFKKMGRLCYEWGYNQISLAIYKYLYECATNPQQKMDYYSNIGTAYRDLTDYDEAIKYYLETRDFFKHIGDKYRYFIEVKNLAYCFYKKGNFKVANRFLAPLEANFSQYSLNDLVNIYGNLAVRSRLMYDFQKEKTYLEKALELGFLSQTLKMEIRLNELINLDLSDPHIIQKLIEKEQKSLSLKAYARFQFHQNHLNPKLAQIYLDEAYSEVPKDIILYWVNKGINEILLQDWDNLEQTTTVIRNARPDLATGNYFFTLIGLHQADYEKIQNGLFLIHTMSDNKLVEIPQKTYNFAGNLIQNYNSEIFHVVVDYFKASIQSRGDVKDKVNQIYLDIMYCITNILIVNEVMDVKYLLDILVMLDPSDRSYMYMADYEMNYERYESAANFYLQALNNKSTSWTLTKKCAEAFLGAMNYSQAITIIERYTPSTKTEQDQHQLLLQHIIGLRDKIIRFEQITQDDVRKVFETTQILYNLSFEVNQVDFGFILSELSKGVELLFYYNLGPILLRKTAEIYPTIPNSLKFGNKQEIKPLNPLYRLYLDDPNNHSPTLGNWNFLFEISIGNKTAENPIMNLHSNILLDSTVIPTQIFEKTKNLIDLLLDPRNKGIHKDLVGLQKITTLFQSGTALINDILAYWYS